MSYVIDHDLTVDAPPGVVWEVISDLPRYPQWNPFCLQCQSTLKPGEPIEMTVKLMLRPQRQREWMVDFAEGERFSYSMKPVPMGALSSLRSHHLEAVGGGRTRYRSHFQLDGWLRFVVTAVLGGKLKAGFDGMSHAVKWRAEALWAERKTAAQS